MAEFSNNLWAPWRMEYIQPLQGENLGGCFLCRYRDTPQDDAANHVLLRTADTLVTLNRFPYSNGHLLVAPTSHVPRLEDLSEQVLCELMARMRDATRVLAVAMQAQGFNLGMNLGRCAGAGLPDHLHWHIVPRWSGDTNFMAVVGDARVVPESLESTARKFREAARRIGVPTQPA